MRASSEPLNLPSQSPNTTVHELKTQYAQKTGQDQTKIKFLLNKRPASDLKTLKELLPEPTPSSVEFSIMIMGGGGVGSPAAPSTPQVASPAVEIPDPVSQTGKLDKMDIDDSAPLSEKAEAVADAAPGTGNSSQEILKSEEFWNDLKDFLIQRIRDEAEGERLVGVFKSAAKV